MVTDPRYLDDEEPSEDDDETGYAWDFDNVYPIENLGDDEDD